jgi:arylsulfatase A-like enzyme
MFVGDVQNGPATVPGLNPQFNLPSVRIRERERLLSAIDRTLREQDDRTKFSDVQGQYAKAFELLTDPRTRQAFDLSQEPDSLRRRYGRHRSGQACLLARRLAAAGVPLITVVWNQQSRGQDLSPDDHEAYGWDTHNDIFDVLKHRLLPRFDQSFSALLEDLDSRGMLDDTLVLCLSEFGRAPLVALEPRFAGASPGRKHWAAAYSIVMAGAGVCRGKVVGKTDREGAYPASESYGPWDIAATVLAALGVAPSEHYRDSLNRPFSAAIGVPIAAAYGD